VIEQIAAQAARVAADGEAARRLPDELVEAMRAADLFRLCVPRSAGGAEASAGELVRVVEALARADGAAGWIIAVQATTGLLAGYLTPDAAAEIFGTAGSVAGGVFAPKGRALADGDVLRASGRWPFSSGCTHADWLCAGCVVLDGDRPRTLASGMPDVYLALVPRAAARIHDTWHVSGLRATASHDMELSDEAVPVGHAVSVFSMRPREPGPLYAFPLFGLLAVAIGGVALGIARGALDDLADLAGAKKPTGSARVLAERAPVQADMARAEAQLRAARALLYDEVAAAYADATESGEVSIERRTGLRLAASHAATTGAEVTATAYRLGGGSAIYDSSPLQRRFRDVNVVTQHMLVAPATWELTGRLLLGRETDTAQL
jgi:indole-3-acetate monooxygenase